jgi:ABC-type phosphate transport system permease subunit
MKEFLIQVSSQALLWIIYLALYPLAFIWLRRAYRIIVRRDFSEVALRRGVSPKEPERFAPYAAAINLLAGSIAVFTAIAVFAVPLAFETWTAIAGSTLWIKIFADFVVSRHAHVQFGRKKA